MQGVVVCGPLYWTSHLCCPWSWWSSLGPFSTFLFRPKQNYTGEFPSVIPSRITYRISEFLCLPLCHLEHFFLHCDNQTTINLCKLIGDFDACKHRGSFCILFSFYLPLKIDTFRCCLWVNFTFEATHPKLAFAASCSSHVVKWIMAWVGVFGPVDLQSFFLGFVINNVTMGSNLSEDYFPNFSFWSIQRSTWMFSMFLLNGVRTWRLFFFPSVSRIVTRITLSCHASDLFLGTTSSILSFLVV